MTLSSIKGRLRNIPLLVHLHRILYRVILEPLNKGERLDRVKKYFLWYLYQKPRAQKTYIQLQNGARSIVYPDSDSGVSNIFTRNVDFADIEFVRTQLDKGDFVVDAGCNVGNRTLVLADIIGGALMIDANPVCIQRARENLELNDIDMERYHLVAKAVGDAVGTISFTNFGAASTQNKVVDGAGDGVVSVPLTTIDVELERIGQTHCEFIKLDLEGHDLQGLRGAVKTLAHPSLKLVRFERWKSADLSAFEAFFASVNMKIFALDSSGRVTFDPQTIRTKTNLFAALIGSSLVGVSPR